MHANGKGVKQNYAEAMRWYLLAAAQGNATALSNLGFMYENGVGVEEDEPKALMYYNKAAKKGDENAIRNIAHIEERMVKRQAK